MNGRGQSGSDGMPRKAMLLAAGKGTRLSPLTEHVSKCMIPIAGKPVLEHNITFLRSYGIIDIIMNLHHLPQTVMNHFGDGGKWSVRINYSFEPELIGTAGAVKKVEDLFDGPFFLWYGDNLSTCRLDSLWRFHQSNSAAATIAVHYREDPTQSGMVELDENDRITRFLEKPRPQEVLSRWVNAGIAVLEPCVVAAIPSEGSIDFGRDVFPTLVEQNTRIFGYRMSASEDLWWIDTPKDLKRVEEALGGSASGFES